jgi:hypothetical protein
MDRFANYLCYRANPLVQVVYNVLVVVCFGGSILYAFPLAQEPFIAWYHKYIGSSMMVANYLIYLKACYTDPGMVTKANHKECI